MDPDSKDEGKKTKLEDSGRMVRKIGQFSTIPFMLLGGLFVGYGAGWLLDKWLHTGPIGMGVLMLVGVAAGFREIIYMLKDIEKDEK